MQAHAIAPVWANVGSRFQRSSILASVSDDFSVVLGNKHARAFKSCWQLLSF